MSPPAGGSAPCCAICGLPLALPAACLMAHPEHCHDCHRANLSQGFDAIAHRPPVPSELVLTPRDVQALRNSQRHLARVEGTGPCTPLVREEGTHG